MKSGQFILGETTAFPKLSSRI